MPQGPNIALTISTKFYFVNAELLVRSPCLVGHMQLCTADMCKEEEHYYYIIESALAFRDRHGQKYNEHSCFDSY